MGKIKEVEIGVRELYDHNKELVESIWNKFVEEYGDRPEAVANVAEYLPDDFERSLGRMEGIAEVMVVVMQDDSLQEDFDELMESMTDQVIELLEKNGR